MVLIIDGEVVADNDPRAIAKRRGASTSSQPSQSSASQQAGRGPRIQTTGGSGGSAGGGGAPPGSPLDALASALGVQGQVVKVPALHQRIPEREVPVVIAGILGVLTLLAGWRILAAAAVLHCVAGFSETAPQAPRGGGGSGGGGAPLGGGASGGRR